MSSRHARGWLRTVTCMRGRALSSSGGRHCGRAVFYDMQHSNNAARIRLFLAHSPSVAKKIDSKMVTYDDIKTSAFKEVNPLQKVPGFIREDGKAVFESSVILNYLEHKYSDMKPSFTPVNHEERQLMELIIRCHDLYISSPNCNQPGFSHCQGAMYLPPYETQFCTADRAIPRPQRAAKIKEIWQQLTWLESNMEGSPFLVGTSLTHADFTWFPTTCFMELMLPRVFGWQDFFNDNSSANILPKLSAWRQHLVTLPEFDSVRNDILSFWEGRWKAGQFEPILNEVLDKSYQWTFPHRDILNEKQGAQKVKLNYQLPPPAGKRTGRYINRKDEGDLADEHVICETTMHNARLMNPPASLDSIGFTLTDKPSQLVGDEWRDDEKVKDVYYQEIMEVVKESSGACEVFIFDHTVRESGNTNLNAAAGQSAAPVPRVHCDYTATGAPRRLLLLGEEGMYSNKKSRTLSSDEVSGMAESKRFAFINVWRSIDDEHPVMQQPLAVCDENSVPSEDKFLYELHFPDRVGENYSLNFNERHKWFYYPKMKASECLIFKVYDKKKDGPRFVFHTSFQDPLGRYTTHEGQSTPPPRRSIEVRTIAFFDD